MRNFKYANSKYFFIILDDGQTCDLAYEMFECVSEKIDEVCIIIFKKYTQRNFDLIILFDIF